MSTSDLESSEERVFIQVPGGNSSRINFWDFSCFSQHRFPFAIPTLSPRGVSLASGGGKSWHCCRPGLGSRDRGVGAASPPRRARGRGSPGTVLVMPPGHHRASQEAAEVILHCCPGVWDLHLLVLGDPALRLAVGMGGCSPLSACAGVCEGTALGQQLPPRGCKKSLGFREHW